MDQSDSIIIDGSLYEGGGQMLRISLALSIIFQKKFEITNIRKSRLNPGINNQLKNTFDLIISIAEAKVQGLKMGSQNIIFEPTSKVQGGKLVCGGKTAQSTCLIFQCLLPILLYAQNETELTIKQKGGTVVSKSPTSPCVEYLLLDLLRRFGININYKCITEGFFPEGRGIVKVNISPLKNTLLPLQLVERKPIKEGQIIFYLTQDKPFKDQMKEICKFYSPHYFSPKSKARQQDPRIELPGFQRKS